MPGTFELLTDLGSFAMDAEKSVASQSKNKTDKPTVVQTVNDISFLFGLNKRAATIAERAKQSIFIYPVVVSTSLQDVDIAANIAKYLEIQYGIFTLITAGINPVANTSVSEHLSVFSGEDGNEVTIKNDDDAEKLAAEIMNNSQESFREYNHTKKYEGKPRLGKNAYISKEGIEDVKQLEDNTIKDTNDTQEEKAKPSVDDYIKSGLDTTNSIFSAINNSKADTTQATKSNTQFMINIENYKANPTILNIKFRIGGGDKNTEINIPIAIKAQLHPLDTSDMKNLLEMALEGNSHLVGKGIGLSVRFIRFLSGELHLFKDIIFQMDMAQKNKELYKKLGKHPWYQRLMQRKAFNKLPILNPILNKYSGGSFKDLPPVASIICTKDDLVSGTKLNYSTFIKDNKLMTTMLDSLYLLCLGIYEPETEKIVFYFSGYKDPFIYSIKEISKSSDKKSDALLNETLNLLAQKI
jgi:hypothetical protein